MFRLHVHRRDAYRGVSQKSGTDRDCRADSVPNPPSRATNPRAISPVTSRRLCARRPPGAGHSCSPGRHPPAPTKGRAGPIGSFAHGRTVQRVRDETHRGALNVLGIIAVSPPRLSDLWRNPTISHGYRRVSGFKPMTIMQYCVSDRSTVRALKCCRVSRAFADCYPYGFIAAMLRITYVVPTGSEPLVPRKSKPKRNRCGTMRCEWILMSCGKKLLAEPMHWNRRSSSGFQNDISSWFIVECTVKLCMNEWHCIMPYVRRV